MARRRLDPNRLIAILGLCVLLLGVLSIYAFSRGGGLAVQQSPSDRAREQLRDTFGRAMEIEYIEEGQGEVICGYAGGGGTMFISRPNRLLLATDPLQDEFEAMMAQACPGFLTAPARPR